MKAEPDRNTPFATPTQYTVTVWETIGILTGAVFLVVAGLAGLGIKAINNIYEPERAEAIARSMITYDLPDSAGKFGANIGGARMAIIASNAPPPGLTPPSNSEEAFPAAIELMIARTPVSQESEESTLDAEFSHEFFSGFSFLYPVDDAFEIQSSRTEYREFCGGLAPVVVQRGILSLPDQTTLPAVRYGVRADRSPDRYLTVIAAIGENASEQAIDLFRSIRCTSLRAPAFPLSSKDFHPA
jgi:hypothetical protein